MEHVGIQGSITSECSPKQQSVDSKFNYNPCRIGHCNKPNTTSADRNPVLPSIIIDGIHHDWNGESVSGNISKSDIRRHNQQGIAMEVIIKVSIKLFIKGRIDYYKTNSFTIN